MICLWLVLMPGCGYASSWSWSSKVLNPHAHFINNLSIQYLLEWTINTRKTALIWKLKFNGKFEHGSNSCGMWQNHLFIFGIHEIVWSDFNRYFSCIWTYISGNKNLKFSVTILWQLISHISDEQITAIVDSVLFMTSETRTDLEVYLLNLPQFVTPLIQYPLHDSMVALKGRGVNIFSDLRSRHSEILSRYGDISALLSYVSRSWLNIIWLIYSCYHGILYTRYCIHQFSTIKRDMGVITDWIWKQGKIFDLICTSGIVKKIINNILDLHNMTFIFF